MAKIRRVSRPGPLDAVAALVPSSAPVQDMAHRETNQNTGLVERVPHTILVSSSAAAAVLRSATSTID
jgi:hypothetical protein